jgi:carbonic anhydrase
MLGKLVAGLHPLRAEPFRCSHGLFERAEGVRGPRALLITCSDLGADPHTLIPTNSEGVYVLQNAGNLVPPHAGDGADGRGCPVSAAIELYDVKDVVVCGHSPCGVMDALLGAAGDEACLARGVLDPVARTRAIMREHYRQLEGEPLRDALAGENVLVQLENLLTIPAVARGLVRGDLRLHGWVLKGGRIYAYGPHAGEFVPLAR